jgi:hypothetical protein
LILCKILFQISTQISLSWGEFNFIRGLQLVKGCWVQFLPMNYGEVQIELQNRYTFEIVGSKLIKFII